MEALTADLKDLSRGTGPSETDAGFPEEGRDTLRHPSRNDVQRTRSMLYANAMTYSSGSSYRLPTPETSRGLERLQDQLFLTVEEIGALVRSQNRAMDPRTCSTSSLPSYDSCLNNHGNASSNYVTRGRRSDATVSDDVACDGRTERESGGASVGRGDHTDDLPPSYEDATQGSRGYGNHRDVLPSLPPAYQDVMTSGQ